jgi:hypothetical protein
MAAQTPLDGDWSYRFYCAIALEMTLESMEVRRGDARVRARTG